jgi:hypothetical protein
LMKTSNSDTLGSKKPVQADSRAIIEK